MLASALCLGVAGDAHAQSHSGSQRQSLKEGQLKYPHVRAAEHDKDAMLRALVTDKGLRFPPPAILLRAFKKEAELELWAADSSAGPYKLLKVYGICATSGVLGPKRRFGDTQVPEGFYDLDSFNPLSSFYLSMHINYPNGSDRVLGYKPNLGGTIYLHGNCASIGCIPITDEGIKEVYWLSVLVRDAGAKHIPIQIFPVRLTDTGFRELAKSHRGQSDLVAFWSNLKEGYDLFETDRQLRPITVAKDGKYEFAANSSAHSQP